VYIVISILYITIKSLSIQNRIFYSVDLVTVFIFYMILYLRLSYALMFAILMGFSKELFSIGILGIIPLSYLISSAIIKVSSQFLDICSIPGRISTVSFAEMGKELIYILFILLYDFQCGAFLSIFKYLLLKALITGIVSVFIIPLLEKISRLLNERISQDSA